MLEAPTARRGREIAAPEVLGAQGLPRYLAVVRRRRLLVILPTLIVPVAAFVFSMQKPAVYEASADVFISRQNISHSIAGLNDPSVYGSPERLIETQADIARSPVIAERVVDKLPPGNATAFLLSTSVMPKQNKDILTFTATSGVPDRAVELANEYARQFITYRAELDTAAISNAHDQIRRRIAQLEERNAQESSIYSSLVEREQQLAELEALQTANSFVIRPAESAGQIEPQPEKMAVLGLLVGLVIGVGGAFLLEALDTRVFSGQQLEEYLEMPLLGRLPSPPHRARKHRDLVTITEPDGPHAEAYRLLRTGIEFANLDHQAATMLFTSAIEGEGKTTTVSNLGVVLAREGRRVALVDLDMRKGTLSRNFRLGDHAGIGDVVLGRTSLDRAVVPISTSTGTPAAAVNGRSASASEFGQLAVLPVGRPLPNPGGFLASPAFGEMLAELAKRFDLILIDTPPLLQVGDALAATPKVDALVLVARLSMIRKQLVEAVLNALRAAPTAKLGFVATGADSEFHGGRYYRLEEPSRRRRATV